MPEDADAPARIDAILAGLPDDQRSALQALRRTIASAAPDAVEGFSYGLPAFRQGGRPIAAYQAARDHCAYYPMSGALVERFRDELAGFETSKGTVRFHPSSPIPADLVVRMVQARIAEASTPAPSARRKPPRP